MDYDSVLEKYGAKTVEFKDVSGEAINHLNIIIFL